MSAGYLYPNCMVTSPSGEVPVETLNRELEELGSIFRVEDDGSIWMDDNEISIWYENHLRDLGNVLLKHGCSLDGFFTHEDAELSRVEVRIKDASVFVAEESIDEFLTLSIERLRELKREL